MNPERKRNIRIGVFAIVAFTILVIGLNYLKGQDVFKSGFRLDAYFPTVDGLAESGPVMYNGFKVGSVNEIVIDQYAEDRSKLFKVVLMIDKKIDVPSDSYAEIVSTDILGGKGVELFLGQNTTFLSNDDVIDSRTTEGFLQKLMPVKDQATSLLISADRVMKDVDTLLDVENKARLDEAILYLAKAMKNVELITRNINSLTAPDGSISSTFSSTDSLMQGLNSQQGRLDSILLHLNTFSADIASANVAHAVASLDSMVSGINALLAQNGNVAKLMNDSQLYENIASMTENMNRLLVDLRLNPSRYINVSAFKFGGKQIYFSDSNTASSLMSGSVYAVSLSTSKSPSDFPTSLYGSKILEYYDGKKYYYLAPFSSESDAQNFISSNNLKSQYPDCSIQLFVDGEKQ